MEIILPLWSVIIIAISELEIDSIQLSAAAFRNIELGVHGRLGFYYVQCVAFLYNIHPSLAVLIFYYSDYLFLKSECFLFNAHFRNTFVKDTKAIVSMHKANIKSMSRF